MGLKLLQQKTTQLMLLVVACLVFGLPLLGFHLSSEPRVLDETYGDAVLHFTADKSRVLFPGECLNITWQLEGIQAVSFNGRGRVGVDQQYYCMVGSNIPFEVQFQDGSSQTYTLRIEQLYRSPIIVGLWVGLIAALGLLLFRFTGAYGLLVLLVIVVYGTMMRIQVNQGGDYYGHNGLVLLGQQNFNALPPHFLYHEAVIGTMTVTGLVVEEASFWVILATCVGFAWALYALLRYLIGDMVIGWRGQLLLCAVVLGLMLVGPIRAVSDAIQFQSFSALINPNTIHSPTMAVLRPLVVLLFLCILKLLAGRAVWRYAALALVLTVLATLTKPNYTLAIAPAMVLLVGFDALRGRKLNWAAIAVGVLLPAVLVLGWQYLFWYGPGRAVPASGEQAKIVLSPLELYLNVWNVPPVLIPLQIVLSVVFPMVVYAVYWNLARRELALNLSWLVFAGGAAMAYLFVEKPGEANGNLTWGGQITLTVLFAVSAGFWLRQGWQRWQESGKLQIDWRFGLCGLAFAAHVVNHVVVLARGMIY